MRNGKKIMGVACACLMASMLALGACAGQSTVVKGSNNDGSKGAAATYKSDGDTYSSAANCAIAYNECLSDLMANGYTSDNVKKFYEQLVNLMPCADMGVSTNDLSSAAAKYEDANQVLKPYIEPAKACSKFWSWCETGLLYNSDLPAVQSAYAKAGGKSTITQATKVRPDFSYTFNEAYEGNAAGATVYKNTFLEGEYFIEIDGHWYLFDANL